MLLEHDRCLERLEKAGSRHDTVTMARCRATPTLAASYREGCLFSGTSTRNDCHLRRTSAGEPPSPCCVPGERQQGQGGNLGLPVFLPGGLANGRADGEGTATSEKRNGWRVREGKRYFLNQSP